MDPSERSSNPAIAGYATVAAATPASESSSDSVVSLKQAECVSAVNKVNILDSSSSKEADKTVFSRGGRDNSSRQVVTAPPIVNSAKVTTTAQVADKVASAGFQLSPAAAALVARQTPATPNPSPLPQRPKREQPQETPHQQQATPVPPTSAAATSLADQANGELDSSDGKSNFLTYSKADTCLVY